MGVFGTDSFSARPRRKTVLVDFVDKGMVRWSLVVGVYFSHPSAYSGSS